MSRMNKMNMDGYQSFRPGQPWLDTEGKRIQAHGGSILFHQGVYYWYGENKEKTTGYDGIWHWGVRLYSSADLYNWKDEGIILEPEPEEPASPLHPCRIMDRPHILYNDRTETFVMWVKFAGSAEQPGNWNDQYYGIAVSKEITGKFQLITCIHPLGMNAGDFDLVKNPSDGKAYIYFERVHTELICADLTEDYLNVTGYYSSHFPNGHPPFVREAPAFFTRKGRLYLFTSGTTGYFPNPTEIAEARLYHGPWTVLGDPCVQDTLHTTFDSQISSVFRHPYKKDLYIALADNWLPDFKKEGRPNIRDIFIRGHSPDRERLPPDQGVDLRSLTAQNTSMANYIWLPVRFHNDKPYLAWYDAWKWEDFE